MSETVTPIQLNQIIKSLVETQRQIEEASGGGQDLVLGQLERVMNSKEEELLQLVRKDPRVAFKISEAFQNSIKGTTKDLGAAEALLLPLLQINAREFINKHPSDRTDSAKKLFSGFFGQILNDVERYITAVEQTGKELDENTKRRLRAKILEVTRQIKDQIPQNTAMVMGMISAEWRSKEKLQQALALNGENSFEIYQALDQPQAG